MGNNNLFDQITGSLPFGDRMQIDSLATLFSDVKVGDLVLDPFCGAGTPSLVALCKGAGVVAGDLDPVACLLTRSLLQPMGLFALRETFQCISAQVADRIKGRYTMACPGCRKRVAFEQLKWTGNGGGIYPDTVVLDCRECGFAGNVRLTDSQSRRQVRESNLDPEQWFPKKKIPGSGSIMSFYPKDLFTSRNLSALADLLHAINALPPGRNREVCQAVFITLLLPCMTGGMSGSLTNAFSTKEIPGLSKFFRLSAEVNVWSAFEHQFNLFLQCKKELNSRLSFLRISDSLDDFEKLNGRMILSHSDCLSLALPQTRKITHVLLDPPGDHFDMYQCISGLQASWLKMPVDRSLFWNSGLRCEGAQAESLTGLLEKVVPHTVSSCRIICAHRSSSPEDKEVLQAAVAGIGYALQRVGPPPVKPEGGQCYAVVRARKRKSSVISQLSDSDINEIALHMRGAAFYGKTKSAAKIHDLVFPIIREHLKEHFARITRKEFRTIVSDAMANQKAYHRLCLGLLSIILAEDRYRIATPETERFEQSEIKDSPDPKKWAAVGKDCPDVDMVAENQEGKKIYFCFYDPKKVKTLKQIAGNVYRQDQKSFQHICYLIFTDQSAMNACRQVEWADNWPRGFFVCFPDLVRKASRIRPDMFGNLQGGLFKPAALVQKQGVKHFKAEVIQNKPVGLDGKPMHYKLAFRTPAMKTIGPGQFIMVDPLSCEQRKKMDRIQYRKLLGSGGKRLSARRPDLSPKSYLKRPFGVQRAYYKYFEWGYHATLSLPTVLAGITHTVFPHQFEVFYKVMEGGIGTREMTSLKKGDQIRVLGPLGKYTHIPGWRLQGIDEVHLVGGGVGMAPLVFFGQALKFYAFKLKAFIGIDRIGSLAEAPYGKSFSEEAGKAYVYIEELAGIGLKPDDIYLSREHTENEALSDKISKDHYHCGLVTEQYRACLEKMETGKNILIIACGPKPMMVALRKIASEFGIPLKVLLEKRMGCGIGVCMSCVCRTQKNRKKQYSRVCVEGPVFDATEIDWEKL